MEYEAISVGYDFELIYALGTFLGIKTRDEILALIDAVEEAGLDAMSAGVVLGWATDAYKAELITEEETLVPLAFGNSASYIEAIRHIAEKTNDFYGHLGKGAHHAAPDLWWRRLCHDLCQGMKCRVIIQVMDQ